MQWAVESFSAPGIWFHVCRGLAFHRVLYCDSVPKRDPDIAGGETNHFDPHNQIENTQHREYKQTGLEHQRHKGMEEVPAGLKVNLGASDSIRGFFSKTLTEEEDREETKNWKYLDVNAGW